MQYSKTLTTMIKKSGLSLSQISNKCKELHNVSIDPSYISKLKSGNQSPASDEINIALAKVCGENPDDLLFDAYMEKAPEVVKQLIRSMADIARMSMLSVFNSNIPQDQLEIAAMQVNQMSDRSIIEVMTNSQLLKDINVSGNTFAIKTEGSNSISMLINPYTGIVMPDDSMEPIIPEGAVLQVNNADEIQSGMIVIALDQANNYIIRKYLKFDSNIILDSYNKKFEPISKRIEDYKIVGVVKSYQKEV